MMRHWKVLRASAYARWQQHCWVPRNDFKNNECNLGTMLYHFSQKFNGIPIVIDMLDDSVMVSTRYEHEGLTEVDHTFRSIHHIFWRHYRIGPLDQEFKKLVLVHDFVKECQSAMFLMILHCYSHYLWCIYWKRKNVLETLKLNLKWNSGGRQDSQHLLWCPPPQEQSRERYGRKLILILWSNHCKQTLKFKLIATSFFTSFFFTNNFYVWNVWYKGTTRYSTVHCTYLSSDHLVG